jgi:hypothetical protein
VPCRSPSLTEPARKASSGTQFISSENTSHGEDLTDSSYDPGTILVRTALQFHPRDCLVGPGFVVPLLWEEYGA